MLSINFYHSKVAWKVFAEKGVLTDAVKQEDNGPGGIN